MPSITFDTLEFVKQLRTGGFTELQAEAIAVAHRHALSQALDTSLATKSDVLFVKNEVLAIKSSVDHLDAKFDKLVWMVGILVALAAANFAKQFF